MLIMKIATKVNCQELSKMLCNPGNMIFAISKRVKIMWYCRVSERLSVFASAEFCIHLVAK